MGDGFYWDDEEPIAAGFMYELGNDMNDLELKALENKAFEGLRSAFARLRNDAVMPETMSLHLGDVKAGDGKMYSLELVVVLNSP